MDHVAPHEHDNPNNQFTFICIMQYSATIMAASTQWKNRLFGELISLQENLGQIFRILGISVHNIIGNPEEEDALQTYSEAGTHETVINEYLYKIQASVRNIDILLNIDTNYDLPIPVEVLLRFANRLTMLRWDDYKSEPIDLMRKHIYSLTPQLIDTGLSMTKSVMNILETNIIPFMPSINHNVMQLLEWTRSSNLLEHEPASFHIIRKTCLDLITHAARQLALNINLSPQQLKSLIDDEIVEICDKLEDLAKEGENFELVCAHHMSALNCLETLMPAYLKFLDAKLEHRVKEFVGHSCINLYREYQQMQPLMKSAQCRMKLLQVLHILANQPYATSTSEIAHNIFALASKLERDADVRAFARKSLLSGVPHRPVIVASSSVFG